MTRTTAEEDAILAEAKAIHARRMEVRRKKQKHDWMRRKRAQEKKAR